MRRVVSVVFLVGVCSYALVWVLWNSSVRVRVVNVRVKPDISWNVPVKPDISWNVPVKPDISWNVPATPAPPSRVHHVGIQNAYYINLQHREDRRRQIEQTLGDAFIPFERFDGVNARLDENKHLIAHCFDATICPGQVGCQLSHMRVLDAAMARGVEHIAVFEDDFVFQGHVNLSMVQSAIQETMSSVPYWDVIVLSLNILSETVWKNVSIAFSDVLRVHVSQVHEAQTTGGYIARRSIMPAMYAAFAECNVTADYVTAIDQCWKPLQHRFVWVGFEPQPGTQMKSFSDIEQRDVNYQLHLQ